MKPQIEIQWNEAIEIAENAKAQKIQDDKDFQETLDLAREEVIDRTYNGPFNYEDIEDIMHGYGLEMDYILDFF